MSARTHPGKLPRKMHAAVAALLTAPTEAAAASQVGIGEATLRRWKQRPEFQEVYRAASRERLAGTIGRLRAAAGEAVDTLRAALRDEVTSNRIRAATVLLDSALKAEVDDLSRRVEFIEQKQLVTAALDAVRRKVETFLQGRGQPE